MAKNEFPRIVDLLDGGASGQSALEDLIDNLAPDTSLQIVSPDATDLASVITLANEIKASFNQHITDSN